MDKNIKSPFIKQKILSYVDKKRKLKLFKYNKHIQNLINVKLIDYKLASKTFIIYQNNKKEGRQFISKNKKLIYEGEFLNDKRNGKGKEYFISNYIYNDSIYEGEFLNGEKNGKGKEYYEDGTLIFEGEYLNDKRWNGNGYDICDDIIYTLKEGNGPVKEYNSNGTLKFEGNYLNGEKDGICYEYNGDGKLRFEGRYYKGKKNGEGMEYGFYGTVEFKGVYKNDKKWSGNGLDIAKNTVYTIENGKGIIKKFYVGVYRGLRFEGEYLNGEVNGKVKEYYNQGKLLFEGEYLNGERNGKGKEYYFSGKLIFEGEYFNHTRRKGKEYNREGNLVYEGEYIYGDKWIGKEYDEKGNLIYEYCDGNKKIIS